MSPTALNNPDDLNRNGHARPTNASVSSTGAAGQLSDPSHWVELHGDAMFRFAMLRVKRANIAEEAVQDAFLAALTARSSFDGRSSERTWMIGILRFKLIDLLRKRRRDSDKIVSVGDPESALFDHGIWIQRPNDWNVASSDVESEEFQRVLGGCVEALPSPMREAFCLRILDEIPSDDVCKCLGVTATNLWTLVHRAKLRLRTCLTKRWFDGEKTS